MPIPEDVYFSELLASIALVEAQGNAVLAFAEVAKREAEFSLQEARIILAVSLTVLATARSTLVDALADRPVLKPA
jgi:hypothetical protein